MEEELEQGHSSQENVAPFKFYWMPFSLEVALESCSIDLLPTLPSSVQVPEGRGGEGRRRERRGQESRVSAKRRAPTRATGAGAK